MKPINALEEHKAVHLPIDQLYPFVRHPYLVRDDAEMEELAQSIRENGVLSPVIVRPLENAENKYEIVSGHRRVRAAKKAGFFTVPAFVYDISRDEAAVLLVDSNLHRERLLPSEKAFAYKLKLEALRHQGLRTDLTSTQIGEKMLSVERVAAESETSREQVRRYIRLTHLSRELLNLMDEGKIAFSVGVELSYLPPDMQHILKEEMEIFDCTPSYSQAVRLHRAANAEALDVDLIEAILSEPKANQQEHIRLKRDSFAKYFPSSYTPAQIERDILKGLELLKRQRDRSRDAR